MVDLTLKFIAGKLQDHFQGLPGSPGAAEVPEIKVDSIARLAEDQHSVRNTVCISLVNISEEVIRKNLDIYKVQNSIKNNTPISYTLIVLISFDMDNYEHALHYLSETLFFYRDNPHYEELLCLYGNSVDRTLFNINLEMMTLSLEESNDLWGMLQTSYLPNLLYKIRMNN
jgi:hypothetical protein